MTGYDNTDAASAHADEEVYLYHAPVNPAGETGSLVCASCDPTGARPVGVFDEQERLCWSDRGETWIGHKVRAGPWLAGSIPGWDRAFGDGSQYQPRYLSDSGRLFFNSPDDLVPHATNGVEDVYEFEPEGLGSCATGSSSGNSVYVPARAFEVEGRQGESFAGCVGLISSGTSSQESAFFDASRKRRRRVLHHRGKARRRGLRQRLRRLRRPRMRQRRRPLHRGTGVLAAMRLGRLVQGRALPQPEIFGPAPSATFTGAGNTTPEVAAKPAAKTKAKPKACKRGFVKKHGRCVRKPKSKRAKAKKSSDNRRVQ